MNKKDLQAIVDSPGNSFTVPIRQTTVVANVLGRGPAGVGLEYDIIGHTVGFRREGEEEFEYIEISASMTAEDIEKVLGYKPAGDEELRELEAAIKADIATKVSQEKFDTAIAQLKSDIEAIDVPEGVDLSPVYAEINQLKEFKADKDKVVTSVNGQTGDVVVEGGSGGGGYVVPRITDSPVENELVLSMEEKDAVFYKFVEGMGVTSVGKGKYRVESSEGDDGAGAFFEVYEGEGEIAITFSDVEGGYDYGYAQNGPPEWESSSEEQTIVKSVAPGDSITVMVEDGNGVTVEISSKDKTVEKRLLLENDEIARKDDVVASLNGQTGDIYMPPGGIGSFIRLFDSLEDIVQYSDIRSEYWEFDRKYSELGEVEEVNEKPLFGNGVTCRDSYNKNEVLFYSDMIDDIEKTTLVANSHNHANLMIYFDPGVGDAEYSGRSVVEVLNSPSYGTAYDLETVRLSITVSTFEGDSLVIFIDRDNNATILEDEELYTLDRPLEAEDMTHLVVDYKMKKIDGNTACLAILKEL